MPEVMSNYTFISKYLRELENEQYEKERIFYPSKSKTILIYFIFSYWFLKHRIF